MVLIGGAITSGNRMTCVKLKHLRSIRRKRRGKRSDSLIEMRFHLRDGGKRKRMKFKGRRLIPPLAQQAHEESSGGISGQLLATARTGWRG